MAYKQKLQILKIQSQLWITIILIIISILSIVINKGLDLKSTIVWISIPIITGWWLWTMYVINTLINQRIEEYEILQDITSHIKTIKEEIKEK